MRPCWFHLTLNMLKTTEERVFGLNVLNAKSGFAKFTMQKTDADQDELFSGDSEDDKTINPKNEIQKERKVKKFKIKSFLAYKPFFLQMFLIASKYLDNKNILFL